MGSKVNNRFGRVGIDLFKKNKIAVIVFYLGLLTIGILGLDRIVMDDSYESMLKKDDPISKNNTIFKEVFGNSEYIFILLEADNIFNNDVLAYIRELGGEIEENLPFVKDYIAITNVEHITADDDNLIVKELISSKAPISGHELDSIRNRALNKEIYKNRIVNTKGNQTGIFIRLETIPDSCFALRKIPDNQPDGVYFSSQIVMEQDSLNNYKLVKDPTSILTPTVKYIINKQDGNYKTTLTGTPVSDYYIMKILQEETFKTFLITLAFAIILLIVLYRSFVSVIAPILTIFSSIIITFGLLGWFNVVVSTYALVVILLLFVISLGYSIHLINHFRASFLLNGNRLEGVKYALEQSGWPCFISAATTVIGFISFLVVDIVPVKNMGLACAIGVFITFVHVIILIPFFHFLGKDKVVNIQNKNTTSINKGSEIMRNWATITISKFKITVVVTSVIVVVSFVYMFDLKADTNYVNLFGEKIGFVQDAIHSTKNIGSLYSYEVMIELPEEGMAKQLNVLKANEELAVLINSFQTTKMTSSVNDLLKDINQTMHGNDTSFYKIPTSQNLIAQYFLLYEMSGGEELENWVDFSYQNIRNSVYVKESTTDLIASFEEIESFVKEKFPEGTVVRISGNMATVLRAISALVDGQIKSILFAFIGIAIMMMITLKSVKAGLFSMIPNIIPLFIIMGFMGMTGITLNIQSMIVAPLILGIAVDDTVHYFLHFKREFDLTQSYKRANQETFVKVGWTLIYTSIILVIGFLPYSFSSVVSFKQLSVLIILGVLVALLADLLITPALFNIIKPFGKSKSN